MAELHYRLTHQEWCRLYKQLTESEKGVLLYLRTLDPFGDNYREIRTIDIADDLGISQRSVQRAVLRLSELQLIDLKMTQFQFRIKSRHQCEQTTSMSSSEPGDASRSVCRQCDLDDANSTPVTFERHEDRDRTLEPSQAEASTSSHTDQTDQLDPDLSPASSEREEALLEFIGSQNPTARNRRAYALKCLSNDRGYWEERYRQYLQSQARASIPPPVTDLNFSAIQPMAALVDTPESRLSRLRAKWLMPNLRGKIQQEIADHPEWGLAIVNGEVVEVQQLVRLEA